MSNRTVTMYVKLVSVILLSWALLVPDNALAHPNESARPPRTVFGADMSSINCLVLSPPPDQFALDHVERLSDFIEQETGFRLAFRYLGGKQMTGGPTLEDAIVRTLSEALTERIPPDIVLDVYRGVVGFQAFEAVDESCFSNVVDLSKRRAPDVYYYLRDTIQTGHEQDAVYIPVKPQSEKSNIWLVKRNVWERKGKPKINTFSDMIQFLQSVADDGYYEHVGVRPAYDHISGYLHLFLDGTMSPIANVYCNGIYRRDGGVQVFSVFDMYPERLRNAVGRCWELKQQSLFAFNVVDPSDVHRQLMSNEWVAFSMMIGPGDDVGFSEYMSVYGFDNIKPFLIDAPEHPNQLPWPGNHGFLIPLASGKSEIVMEFLQAITEPTIVESIHYGVPGVHYTKTGIHEYESLDGEGSYMDMQRNPFAALCVVPPPVLIEARMPAGIQRLLVKKAGSSGQTTVDPLDGFVFRSDEVEAAFSRYNSTHLLTWFDLLKSDPSDFDVRYDDFRNEAESDFAILKAAIQEQIDAFLSERR